MKKTLHAVVLVGVTVAMCGCGGGTWIRIPPAIDLTQHEILGVIAFASTAKGKLAAYTTQAFIEEMRADQGMIRIVELGPRDELLESEGLTRLDREAFQAIGKRHGLTTIVAGDLEMSDVRPAVRLSPSLSGVSAAADVDARLSVRMIDAESGASVWNRTAEATRRVGHVRLIGGSFDFDADDPERAYGDLVRALAEIATADFKVTWEKQ
jgi:hypothetical protein